MKLRVMNWFILIGITLLSVNFIYPTGWLRNLSAINLIHFIFSPNSSNIAIIQSNINQLSRCIAVHPNDIATKKMLAKFLTFIGRDFSARGQRDAAIDYWNRAWALDSTIHLLNHDLGVAYAESGQPERAIFFLERQQTLHPEPWSWVYLGTIYLNLKNLDKAEECYRAALKMSPWADDGAYDGLARLFIQRANCSRAVSYAKKALELRPERCDYWNGLIQAYRCILKTDPNNQAIRDILKSMENSSRCK
jgi:tetratricopeptide (TPR) repeat protein